MYGWIFSHTFRRHGHHEITHYEYDSHGAVGMQIQIVHFMDEARRWMCMLSFDTLDLSLHSQKQEDGEIVSLIVAFQIDQASQYHH